MSNDRQLPGGRNVNSTRGGVNDYELEAPGSEDFFVKFHELWLANSASGRNTHRGVTKYKALVLTTPTGPATSNTGGRLSEREAKRRYTFKIRIDELHSSIPDPCSIVSSIHGAEDDPRAARYIERHPMAISANLAEGVDDASKPLPPPSVGDTVWVEFEKAPGAGGRMATPVYVGIFDRANANSGQGSSQPNNVSLGRGCEKYQDLFNQAMQQDVGVMGRSGNGIASGYSSNYRATLRPGPPTAAQQNAAEQLGVEAAVIQAIEAVESGGRPAAVRFEPHLWHRKYAEFGLTEAQRDQMPFTRNNEVPFSRVGSETNEAAFNKAMTISGPLALYSTSFGLYQVMGYNFTNFKTDAEGIVARFRADPEGVSYELLVTWFRGNPKAIEAAKNKDWAELARRYNGPANVARYAPRLEREYAAVTGTGTAVV